MCYTEIIDNEDGTFRVQCYCGWGRDYDTRECADEAAETHEVANKEEWTAEDAWFTLPRNLSG